MRRIRLGPSATRLLRPIHRLFRGMPHYAFSASVATPRNTDERWHHQQSHATSSTAFILAAETLLGDPMKFHKRAAMKLKTAAKHSALTQPK